jgi:hypothetical protein
MKACLIPLLLLAVQGQLIFLSDDGAFDTRVSGLPFDLGLKIMNINLKAPYPGGEIQITGSGTVAVTPQQKTSTYNSINILGQNIVYNLTFWFKLPGDQYTASYKGKIILQSDLHYNFKGRTDSDCVADNIQIIKPLEGELKVYFDFTKKNDGKADYALKFIKENFYNDLKSQLMEVWARKY